jgi:tetratricopeptide (TPR) repeat protein
MKQGNLLDAEKHISQGLELCKQFDYLEGQVSAVRYLGTLHRKQGDFARSSHCYKVALSIARKIDSPERERLMAGVYASYGTLAWRQNNYIDAQKKYRKALAIFKWLGHQPKIADTLSRIASLLHTQGKLDQAKRKYEESQTIVEICHRQNTKAYNLYGLARLNCREGNFQRAYELIQEARTIFCKLAIQHEIGEDEDIKALYDDLKSYFSGGTSRAR